MDITQLIKDSKARFNFNSQKAQLKEKYQAKLIFADQGGLWKCSPELIAFLSSSVTESCILLDLYENPILINKTDLLNNCCLLYNQVMREWYQEFKELENNR